MKTKVILLSFSVVFILLFFTGAVIVEQYNQSDAQLRINNGEFILSNNTWGTNSGQADLTQYIFRNDDTTYGWGWDRVSSTSDEPNYPEVIYGGKPFTPLTNNSLLPVQIKDLNSSEMVLVAESDITFTDGKWNFAFEFWLTSVRPDGGDVSYSITDELMIWYMWGNRPEVPYLENALNDGYNDYDYTMYESQHGNWRYHQFRIRDGQRIPLKTNIKVFIDFIASHHGFAFDDLWLACYELGNEIWDGTSGITTIKTLNYSVNGSWTKSGLPEPDATPTPGITIGDTNGNGSIDIVDALIVAQYYVGLNPNSFTAPLEAGDANCDGTVNIIDALLIAQYYVGLITGFCL